MLTIIITQAHARAHAYDFDLIHLEKYRKQTCSSLLNN